MPKSTFLKLTRCVSFKPIFWYSFTTLNIKEKLDNYIYFYQFHIIIQYDKTNSIIFSEMEIDKCKTNEFFTS